MVSVRGNQTNNKVTASPSTSTNNRAEVRPVNINNQVEATNNLAKYYSEISQDWAVGEGLIQGIDYSSKTHALQSKESATEAKASLDEAKGYTANAVEQIQTVENLALSNISMLEQSVSSSIEQGIQTIGETSSQALTDLQTASNGIISEIEELNTDVIDEINDLADTVLEEIADAGGGDNLKYSNITNCLLEIPQRIKYDLTDGTLTIKAGTVVIVPYGTENLTSQYPVGATFLNDNFKVYDTQYADGKFFVWAELVGDIVRASSSSSTVNKRLLIVDITSGATGGYTEFTSGSGNSTSTSNNYIHYNTTSNLMTAKLSGTISTDVITLPIIEYASDTTYNVASISQVFNGFGYIGTTIWADKGIKGLIPNGRNEDGTLNNIEHVTQKLITRDVTDNGRLELAIRSSDVLNVYAYFTVSDENYLLGNNGAKVPGVSIISIYISNGVITSFNPKQPFRITDNAVSKSGDTMIGNLMINSKTDTSNIIVKGNKAVGTIPSSTYNYGYFGAYDSNNTHLGGVAVMQNASGRILAYLRATADGNGSSAVKQIVVSSDGATSCPASSATNSIVTTTGISKASNGYVKLGNGIIIQWGRVSVNATTNVKVTFPVAFASANYKVIGGIYSTTATSQKNNSTYNYTTTTFNFYNGQGGTCNFDWIAIGY